MAVLRARGQPCKERWSPGGVSLNGDGIIKFDCSSPDLTRSPGSPFAGKIDSPPGQVALSHTSIYDMVHGHFIFST